MGESKTPIVVAISGGGRSLQNLLKQEEGSKYRVVGVIASRECPGLEYARQANIPNSVFQFNDSVIDRDALYQWIHEKDAELVVLAGFLKKFPLIPAWENKVINIHPALLPKYGGKGMYGIRVHQAVKETGDKESGATIHYVNEHFDDGAIIAQAKIQIEPQDTPKEIADRVFAKECELYPKTINKLIDQSLPLPHQKIWILDHEAQ